MAKLAQLVPSWDAGGRAQLVASFSEQSAVSISSPADRGQVDLGASSYADNVFTLRTRWDSSANSNGGRAILAQLDGVLGMTPVIRVVRSNFGIAMASTAKFLFSTDGVNWTQMANRSSDSSYYIASHSAPFTADTVQIAFWVPWATGYTLPYILSIEGSGYVSDTPSTTGYVFENRAATVNEAGAAISSTPLYAFKIAAPGSVAPDGAARRNMVLISGVHGSEDIGNWALKGACDFLVSEDPQAVVLRSWFNTFVYPLVSSAGRKGGSTRGDFQSGYMTTDVNRQWNTSNMETLVKHKAAILADTGGAAEVFMDFHGSVLDTFNHDFYEAGDDIASWAAAIRTYVPGLVMVEQDDAGVSSEWARSALGTTFALIPEHTFGRNDVTQASAEASGANHMRAVAHLAAQGHFGENLEVEGEVNAIDEALDTCSIEGTVGSAGTQVIMVMMS